MFIRDLNDTADRPALTSFFDSEADFSMFERSARPFNANADGVFSDHPPHLGPDGTRKLGLFEGDQLRGVLALSFGFPDQNDSCIELLLTSHGDHGPDTVKHALEHATHLAHERGATRQLMKVLRTNSKVRAFWENEGFAWEQTPTFTGPPYKRYRINLYVYMTRAI